MYRIGLVGTMLTAALMFGTGCDRAFEIVAGDKQYACGCTYNDTVHGGGNQDLVAWVCATEANKASTCTQACANHGSVKTAVNGPYGPCPDQGGSSSSSSSSGGDFGYELSGEEPNSAYAEADPGLSGAGITYNGQFQNVAMSGDVKFTGGCESASCAITFHQMSFTTDSFSVTDGSGSVLVRNVRILTVGDMVGSQSSDGSFQIPYDQIQLLVDASVDGVERGAVFSPASGQGVSGYYVPSTGIFGLSGEFASSAESLEFEIHGAATSRPPVANAGSPQQVTADGSGSARVMLDGSGSYDLDGDLVEIRWYEGTTYLGSGTTPYVTFGIGDHTVTAAVFDSLNKSNNATTTVRVLAP